jgi:hypothetical protein
MDVRDRRLFELECFLSHAAQPSLLPMFASPDEMAPLRELTLRAAPT